METMVAIMTDSLITEGMTTGTTPEGMIEGMEAEIGGIGTKIATGAPPGMTTGTKIVTAVAAVVVLGAAAAVMIVAAVAVAALILVSVVILAAADVAVPGLALATVTLAGGTVLVGAAVDRLPRRMVSLNLSWGKWAFPLLLHLVLRT